MTKAKDTILFLSNFNSWRRSNDNAVAPNAAEVGAAIDVAVNLLRRYDEMERVRYSLEDSLLLSQKDAEQQCYLKEKYIKRWEISEGKLERLRRSVDALNAAIDQFRDATKKEQP